MKNLIREQFFKYIPKGKETEVLEEIKRFTLEYKANNFDVRKMSNGFSIREIKGNKHNHRIFKFRTNRSDRIIFTFGNKMEDIRNEYRDSIIFLEYCDHDKQIVRGKRINLESVKKNIVQLGNELDKEFDDYIDMEFQDYNYNLNYSISRVVSIEELSQMIDEDDEKALYYLNDDQYEVVRNNLTPLFLFGSAGSGKTTIGINKAFILCQNDNSKIGYFTYSKYLVEESEKYFEKICKDEDIIYETYKEKVSFNCVNEYISNQAKRSGCIRFQEFDEWLQTSLLKTKKFSNIKFEALDVWKEIRGIIKGLVPIEKMKVSFNVDELSCDSVEFLINNDLGYEEDNKVVIDNKELARLCDKLNIYKGENKNIINEDLNKIYKKIDEIIYSEKLIDRDIYLNLSHKYSIFNYEDRILIYEITQKYQNWLDSNSQVDENDVVRIVLQKYDKASLELFNFIICDEIQDLTELQIYFLYKIVRNKVNIFFSGDFNQTINPTFFDTGRIEALFKLNNGIYNFNQRILKTNYRSSKNVVEFANKLSKLRIDRLGSHKKHDYEENPIRDYIDKIFLIETINENKEKLLKTAMMRHYVAIVVPDEDEKKKIESYIGRKNIVPKLQ